MSVKDETTGNVAALRELVIRIVKSLGDKAEVAPANMTPHEAAILDQCRAALSAPPRNCDKFGGDYKMLHAAWFDWTGSPSGQNTDSTVELTFDEWLLAPAVGQEGGRAMMTAKYSILPYEEIPEVTRDYVDFLFNVADLGEGCGKLYHMEDKRIELHEKMVAEYGLRYEYTRDAVCYPYAEIITLRPERVAQVIDSNLRWLRDNNPQARTTINNNGGTTDAN